MFKIRYRVSLTLGILFSCKNVNPLEPDNQYKQPSIRMNAIAIDYETCKSKVDVVVTTADYVHLSKSLNSDDVNHITVLLNDFFQSIKRNPYRSSIIIRMKPKLVFPAKSLSSTTSTKASGSLIIPSGVTSPF